MDETWLGVHSTCTLNKYQKWKLQGVTELTRRVSYTTSGKFPFPPRISAWICLTEFRWSLPHRTKYRGIWAWMHKVQGEGEVWKIWGSDGQWGGLYPLTSSVNLTAGKRVLPSSSVSCLISGKQPDTGTVFSLPHADYAVEESSSMLLSKALHLLFYSSIRFFAAQPNLQCYLLIQSSVIVGTLLLTPFV